MTDNRYYGKYRAVVVDNRDPLSLGRMRVEAPSLGVEGWAMPCVPYAGPGVGLCLVPEPGTGVWLEFEAGDLAHPIWTGCFWNPDERPPVAPIPEVKSVRTTTGLTLSLDDSRPAITLGDGDGNNQVMIEVDEGAVTIRGAHRVVVEAPHVELAEGAAQPAVLGDALLAYLNQLVALFNAHLHPGQWAAGLLPVTPTPPVPQCPPATPALLSTKVSSA